MRTRVGLIVLASIMLIPWQAAAQFEISLGFSYNRSNYSNDNYQWNRRWGGSVGYHFTERTEIELSYQDVLNRTFISGLEDTTFHDQVYGANLVQSFLGRNAPIQPYVKAGIGQLNREARGTYENGSASPPTVVDSVTGILGVGMRVYFTRRIAFRAEGTSYLEAAQISSWQDNFAVTMGFSVQL